MKKSTLKILFLTLTCVLTLAACDDPLTTSDTARLTAVIIDISLPDLPEGAEVADERVTFSNLNSGQSSTFLPDAGISVLPGVYDVSYSARVFTPGAATTNLRANVQSVSISSATARVELNPYNCIDSDDLIIAEIFFAGTLQPSGNSYIGDDYIKLYNNTDHTIYADGLTLFESKFLTTRKYAYSPDIMAEAMTVQALYTIPGSGKDVAVEPGEYLLLADTGIDHRVANPNSFDLSGADFEWFDQSTVPTMLDIDGEPANLDKWYCYTNSVFMLHNRGFRAVGIARIPVDRTHYLENYKYDYEYDEVTVAGTFPMSQSAYRLPNEWIVDVVNCSVASEYAWQVTASSLDCGWTACGTIDKDKTRFFHSVRRKLLYVAANGRAVFADTNNSSADFNGNCIASEIELQHTATDVNGTPATSITYDGAIPRL